MVSLRSAMALPGALEYGVGGHAVAHLTLPRHVVRFEPAAIQRDEQVRAAVAVGQRQPRCGHLFMRDCGRSSQQHGLAGEQLAGFTYGLWALQGQRMASTHLLSCR